jgi:hypothetical protein
MRKKIRLRFRNESYLNRLVFVRGKEMDGKQDDLNAKILAFSPLQHQRDKAITEARGRIELNDIQNRW